MTSFKGNPPKFILNKLSGIGNKARDAIDRKFQELLANKNRLLIKNVVYDILSNQEVLDVTLTRMYSSPSETVDTVEADAYFLVDRFSSLVFFTINGSITFTGACTLTELNFIMPKNLRPPTNLFHVACTGIVNDLPAVVTVEREYPALDLRVICDSGVGSGTSCGFAISGWYFREV